LKKPLVSYDRVVVEIGWVALVVADPHWLFSGAGVFTNRRTLELFAEILSCKARLADAGAFASKLVTAGKPDG
jgi:hypothetical protein